MIGSPIFDGLLFLVNTLFILYLFVLMLRVLLPLVDADYYNPVTQCVLKFTQPLIAPIQGIFPKYKRIDTAAILVLWLFSCLKDGVLFGLLLQTSINFGGLALLGMAEIFEILLQFYFFAVIIYVIVSWVQPNSSNPFIIIIIQLTEPVLTLVRRALPSFGNVDLSPLVVVLLLQFINIILLEPLIIFAQQLTAGVLR